MSAPYGAPQQVPRPPATPEPSGAGTDLTSYLSMGAAGVGLIGYVLGFVDTDVAGRISGLAGFSFLIASTLAGMRLLPKAPGTLYAAPPLALYATLALLQQVVSGSSAMVIVLFVLALLQCGALVAVVLIEADLIGQKKGQQPAAAGQAPGAQPPPGPPQGPGRGPAPGGPHTGPQPPAPPRQPGPHQSGPYPQAPQQQPPQQQAPYPPQPPQGPYPGQQPQQPWNAPPSGWNAGSAGNAGLGGNAGMTGNAPPGGPAPASAGFASQPTESTALGDGPAENKPDGGPDLLGEFSRDPARESNAPASDEFRPADERQESRPIEEPGSSNGPQGTQQMPHPGREGGSTPPTF